MSDATDTHSGAIRDEFAHQADSFARSPTMSLAETLDVVVELAPEELPAWNALAPDLRESALLVRWTAKEAWFKASPPEAAPWSFRHIAARACAPADANVRAWTAAPLHVALCSADAHSLATADCEGLPCATTRDSFWHVHRTAQAT